MKLSDALLDTFEAWQIEAVFGVSGANIEHLHDAIHRRGHGQLKSVLARTEMGAAFMADAYARVHRRLGVCCSTSGGGMMNLSVGLAESFSESVPVLAIVGQPPTSLEGRGAFQDSSGIGRSVDAEALFGAITKFTHKLTSPSEFWDVMEASLKAMMLGRPGPAAILIPRDLYDAEVGERPDGFLTLDDLPEPQPADPTDIATLDSLLRHAKKPVLVMGTGVRRSARPAAVRQYAIDAGIPVVTTISDVGAFPHDNPLYLGTIGIAGNPSAHRYLCEEADVIVAVGTGFNIMVKAPIQPAFERAHVVAVNIDTAQFQRHNIVNNVVTGDAGTVFGALSEERRKSPFLHHRPAHYRMDRVVPTIADPKVETQAVRDAEILLQSEALNILDTYLPERGHLFFDAGNCAASALHYLTVPGQTSTTIALGMGGMGYAIAGAIGAQLGATTSERTTVICGDGAFLMLGFEVHTAVELGLPILFVVFNNEKHGMCVTRQKLFFEGRVEASQYHGLAVDRVARGMGDSDRLWVGRAATPSELRHALQDYQSNHDRPGVLELRLPIEEMPPFTPFLPANVATYEVAQPSRTAQHAA